MQAPVSDREYPMAMDPNYNSNLQIATNLVAEGKSEEMMPRHVFWAPITAQRFLDLQSIGGRDDYFSSDFTDTELTERLRHVGTLVSSLQHMLVAFSGCDEYIPSHIDKRLLTNRLVQAMNADCGVGEEKVAQALYLDTANHNLSDGPEDAGRFVKCVTELLKSVS